MIHPLKTFGSALLLLLMTGCEAPPERDQAEQPTTVTLATVQARTFRETVSGIGSLTARQRVMVRPEIAGILKTVHFEEGEQVQEGDLLFSLDASQQRAQLAEQKAALQAAEAQAAQAEVDFQRARRLRQENVLSQDQFDQAQTALRTARAEVNRLRAGVELSRELLSKTRILAPTGGRLADLMVDPGNYVQPGQALVDLYDVEEMRASFTLPERAIGRVELGQTVLVSVPATPTRDYEGEVIFVSPAVDPATRDFLVKARVPNERGALKPGAFVTAVVVVDERVDEPAVPGDALVATREGYLVYVVEEQIASAVPVKVGLRDEKWVQVTGELSAGQKVVQHGHMTLSEGDKVEVSDAETSVEQESAGPSGEFTPAPGDAQPDAEGGGAAQ